MDGILLQEVGKEGPPHSTPERKEHPPEISRGTPLLSMISKVPLRS